MMMSTSRDVTDVLYDTCIRMLYFTMHYKDTIQEKLTVLISFLPNLLEYTCANMIKIELGLTKLLHK